MPSRGEKRKEHNRRAKERLVRSGVPSPAFRRYWTPEEDQLIMREDLHIGEMSRRLNRSVDAIYMRRSRIYRRDGV